jgi:catechol 2,3-dioxygenase-like lactoylglutathione lyase family enzyme
LEDCMRLGEIRNFDYAVLLCDRMAETRAFYRDVMQFPIETDRGRWAVCDDGRSTAGSAAVQLAFRVLPSAVEACHAELVAKGIPILREPTDLPDWRHRTLFFRDPENNIIEIYAEY